MSDEGDQDIWGKILEDKSYWITTYSLYEPVSRKSLWSRYTLGTNESERYLRRLQRSNRKV